MDHPFIPFHKPSIGEEEIAEVAETLRSGWLTTGPKTAQFEREFAQYTHARHALAVNSCTAAMHLALAALEIGRGDEVITSPMTFCATVNTILHVGATPVLADIDRTGNIDAQCVEAKITTRTRALMPVHLGGLACDTRALGVIAARHSLRVIDDAAHAVGTIHENWPIGAAEAPYAGDASCFSFYATKNMTTGEGGMVTANDAGLADRMRVLCLHGISKDAWGRYTEKGNWFYEVLEPGFKYNLSDLQSAIGIHQLRKLEAFIAARQRLAKQYAAMLGDLDEIELPPDAPTGSRHAWHLYAIRLRLDRLRISRDEFIDRMRAHGIGVSVHFIPIPLHPLFRKQGHRAADCPKAVDYYRRVISLPIYPALTDEQQRRVVEVIKSIVHASRLKRWTAASEEDGEVLSQVPALAGDRL